MPLKNEPKTTGQTNKNRFKRGGKGGPDRLQDRVDSDRFVDCMIAHGIGGRTMYEHWKKGE